MIKQNLPPTTTTSLNLPLSSLYLPRRRFQLDHHSEYYPQDRKEMKQSQMVHFRECYSKYSNIIIFDMERVKGAMLMKLRREIRFLEMGELMVAKNTVLCRIMKEMMDDSNKEIERNALEELSNRMNGEICLLFTNGDCLEVKRFVESKVTHEFPKVGDKVLEDYYLDPYLTFLDPTRTSFFASLNVSTKITRGRIEILNRPLLLRKGEFVGHSAYQLLLRLDMKPIKIGLKALRVFDIKNHCSYDVKMLDYDLNQSVNEAMNNIGSISMECNLVNELSVIISLKKGIYDVRAIEKETENSKEWNDFY